MLDGLDLSERKKYIFNYNSLFSLNGLVGNTFLSAPPDTPRRGNPFHLFLTPPPPPPPPPPSAAAAAAARHKKKQNLDKQQKCFWIPLEF